MIENKRILSVLAHPDDESFGMGGTLAYYAAQGVEVYLICATRGEAGEVEDKFLKNYKSKAELRMAELECAAKKLGIKEVIFLDYRDSGMVGSEDNHHPNALAAQDVHIVAEKIVKIIRKVKPQVVLTFDPVGGYHHPDHIAIHDATVIAFEASDNADIQSDGETYKPERLYFHIFPRTTIRILVKLMKFLGVDVTQFGKNKDINLETLAGDADYPKHVTINYKNFIKQKDEASDCHASQLDYSAKSASLITWLRRITGGKDGFMQAYPIVNGKMNKTDLFR